MKGADPALIPLVIVGVGGHGREVLDIVEAVNARSPTLAFLGFVDDNQDGTEVLARRGARIVGGIDDLTSTSAAYVLGIGSPQIRRHIDERVPGACRPATLIHPSASVGSDVHLGPGNILAAGARITTNVRTGRHTHMNVAATVAHDCRLGDYVSLSPGVHLSGNVVVEDGVLLGTGAVVTPGCRIGAQAVVGAGAVVVDDVAPGTTVVGVPARDVRR